MAIVKFEAINKAETELVKKYLGMGLELDINAMSGTQGERGKIALADDKNVYFIYTDRDYKKSGDSYISHPVIKVVVERHDRDRRDLIDTWHTYWLGKGEVIEEIIFYELDEHSDDVVYVTDEVEFIEIQKKRHERRSNRRKDIFLEWKKVNYNANTIINIVKAKTGRKRVNTENIVEVEKRYDIPNYWRITTVFSGKKSSFSIHL